MEDQGGSGLNCKQKNDLKLVKNNYFKVSLCSFSKSISPSALADTI